MANSQQAKPLYSVHAVGSVQVVALYDTVWRLRPSEFLPAVEPEVWRALTGAPADQFVESRVLCFVLRDQARTLLVDCGVGRWGWWAYGPSHLLGSMSAAGLAPGEVDVVLITHLHPDHAGGATSPSADGPVPTFPNAHYVVGRRDWETFSDPSFAAVASPTMAQALETSVLPLGRHGVLDLVDGIERLTPEVDLLPTPGHTPGAMTVRVRSQGQAALLIGDVAHHRAQLRRPQWGARNDFDPAASSSSRSAVVREATALGALIGATHFEHDAPALGPL